MVHLVRQTDLVAERGLRHGSTLNRRSLEGAENPVTDAIGGDARHPDLHGLPSEVDPDHDPLLPVCALLGRNRRDDPGRLHVVGAFGTLHRGRLGYALSISN